jgi:hypothetical protein
LIFPHRRTWLVVAALSLGLSIAAVTVNAWLGYRVRLGALGQVADRFAVPGEFLWWITLGGAFAGRPSGAAGITLWVVGTALFWFLAAAGVLLLFAWFRNVRQTRNK